MASRPPSSACCRRACGFRRLHWRQKSPSRRLDAMRCSLEPLVPSDCDLKSDMGNFNYKAIARLKPGVTSAAGKRRIGCLAEGLYPLRASALSSRHCSHASDEGCGIRHQRRALVIVCRCWRRAADRMRQPRQSATGARRQRGTRNCSARRAGREQGPIGYGTTHRKPGAGGDRRRGRNGAGVRRRAAVACTCAGERSAPG